MPELNHSPIFTQMVSLVEEQQRLLVTQLEEIDGTTFKVDDWTRPSGGHGRSCVIEDGTVFERGGVNISNVHGTITGASALQMRASHDSIPSDMASLQYSAVGLSLILHAKNPMAPTVHMNCRFLEIFDSAGNVQACWFGGGTDLTPCYLFEDDARHFHISIKTICDQHDKTYYPRFKKWCDQYFRNTHRDEARGIGGIFFDDLDGGSAEELKAVFAFVESFLKSFPTTYMPIIMRRRSLPFTNSQKEWQQIRRGRYVEFNLLHDRGTKFGMSGTTPRIESILISMPMTASWKYCHEPEAGSKEQDIIDVLREPKEWVD